MSAFIKGDRHVLIGYNIPRGPLLRFGLSAPALAQSKMDAGSGPTNGCLQVYQRGRR